MYWTVDIEDSVAVKVDFSEGNINSIIKQLKDKVSDNFYTEEELKQIEDSLKKLSLYNQEYNVLGYLEDIELDEDEIDDAYFKIHEGEGSYDDGYDEALECVRQSKIKTKMNNGLLLQKLEHLAYGYGNQEPLTKDEIKKIKELLDNEYED